MSPSFRRFAANALTAFIAGAVAIMILEVVEQNGLISNLTESISRLAVWSVLVILLFFSSSGLSATARLTFRFCVLCLLLDFALDVVEDVDYLSQLPLIGGESQWRHTVEKATVSCWACAAFCLMYVLMRDLESAFADLHKQNNENAQLNQKLRASLDDLQVAQEQIIQQERLAALGQMASGVAHDLNNALTPVLAFSNLLLESPHSYKERLEELECIHLGASHAAEVVDQLQHFYRDNSNGSTESEIQNVSLSEIVGQAKNLSRFRWSDEAIKRGVRFDILLNLGESNIVISGNRTELIQLVTNLLLNAIESMENGGTINVSTDQLDGWVELTVSDQGVGMTADERKRCFEPFFSRKQSGTGLGLSVCHGIVRRHGGTIRCDANGFGGCDFKVSLPFDVENVEITRDKDEPAGGSGFRVLVIDDDDLVLTSMSAMLSFLGNTVDTANDAKTGTSLARSHEYDLVITDLGMPGIGGRGVVSAIKGFRPSQPIAVSSGWSPDEVRREFQDLIEPDFFIKKPVNASKLRRVLDDVVGTKG